MLLIEEEKQTQLELFEVNLPYKPWCSNVKGPIEVLPKELAKLKKYIQHNEPTKIRWIVFDCDYPGVQEHIGQNVIPPPNIIVTNRINGHSHLFYCLAVPVCITDNGRWKPKDFLRKISFVLGEALLADQGYRGFISKNPLNEAWEVFELPQPTYELNDFLEWLEIPKELPPVYKLVGVGRNVTLFETCRKWAYRQVLAYRLSGTKDQFSEAVLKACEEVNQSFPVPLNFPEVRTTAKSIAKWTWEHYTARWSDREFSQVQAHRGRIGGLKSGIARFENSVTKEKPWEELGISRATWYRRQKAK